MAGIFISYRKDDTGPWAVAVRQKLVRSFGDDKVFLDVDTLGPGDWRAQLERRLDACRVVLVLIGRGWSAARDSRERPRLFQDDDVHRAEIARALATPGITVIPVLLDGAAMPRVDDVPDDLKALVRCQATELGLGAARRTSEMRYLIRQIEELTGQARLKRVGWMALGLAVALGIVNSLIGRNSVPVAVTFLLLSGAVLLVAAAVSRIMIRQGMKGVWPAMLAVGLSLAIVVGSFLRMNLVAGPGRGVSTISAPWSAHPPPQVSLW